MTSRLHIMAAGCLSLSLVSCGTAYAQFTELKCEVLIESEPALGMEVTGMAWSLYARGWLDGYTSVVIQVTSGLHGSGDREIAREMLYAFYPPEVPPDRYTCQWR
jgi:hypothetical protein